MESRSFGAMDAMDSDIHQDEAPLMFSDHGQDPKWDDPNSGPMFIPFSSQVSAEEKYHTFTSCAALNSAALKYGSLLTDADGCCWILCETKWTPKTLQ